MKNVISLIAYAVLAVSSTPCENSKSQTISVSLPLISHDWVQLVDRNNQKIPSVDVSGNITFIDSCSFKVTDFYLEAQKPEFKSKLVWYGRLASNNSMAVLLSPDEVKPQKNGESPIYPLKSEINSEVSFDDIDAIELFDLTNDVWYAIAVFPPPVEPTIPLPEPVTPPAPVVPAGIPDVKAEDQMTTKTNAASYTKSFPVSALLVSLTLFLL